MKALVKKEAQKGIWMEEVAVPKVGVNDVLIKIKKTSFILYMAPSLTFFQKNPKTFFPKPFTFSGDSDTIKIRKTFLQENEKKRH